MLKIMIIIIGYIPYPKYFLNFFKKRINLFFEKRKFYWVVNGEIDPRVG